MCSKHLALCFNEHFTVTENLSAAVLSNKNGLWSKCLIFKDVFRKLVMREGV
jgi:hypothetical protein